MIADRRVSSRTKGIAYVEFRDPESVAKVVPRFSLSLYIYIGTSRKLTHIIWSTRIPPNFFLLHPRPTWWLVSDCWVFLSRCNQLKRKRIGLNVEHISDFMNVTDTWATFPLCKCYNSREWGRREAYSSICLWISLYFFFLPIQACSPESQRREWSQEN